MNIVHNFQIISFSSLLLLASWGININEANSATVKKFIRGTLETGATFSGTFSYNLDQLDQEGTYPEGNPNAGIFSFLANITTSGLDTGDIILPYGRIYQSDFPITSLSLEFSYYSEEREIFLYLDFTGNIVGYPEKLISSENWDLLRFKQGIFQEFNSSTSTPEGFLLSVDEISINNSVIPEPLTILGTLTGLGFGIFFKQKSAKHK